MEMFVYKWRFYLVKSGFVKKLNLIAVI